MKEPIDKENLDLLCAYAQKVVEAKGYRFYRYVYEQAVRDVEKYHGIKAPTHSTRKSGRKNDEN